jgi:hypothetical protein
VITLVTSRTAVDPSMEAAGEPSMVRTLRSMTSVITLCVGAAQATSPWFVRPGSRLVITLCAGVTVD